MANILSFFELEQHVKSLEPSKIKEIGTKSWFENNKLLEQLRQQSISEISNFSEEKVKEVFYEHRKVAYLIHEAIVIQVWREKVWKKMASVEKVEQLKHHFIVYMVLYHEITALNLLQMLLYHRDMIQLLGDFCLDLIDYCASQVVHLIQMKPISEVEIQEENGVGKINEREMALNRGLQSVTILASLAEYIDDLSVSDVVRLYQTHDIPLLLAHLIETQPWRQGNKVYSEGRWLKQNPCEVSKSEAQCWLGIRGLLLHEAARRHYEITAQRQRQLMSLQGRLTETLVDQISPLLELRRWLAHVAMAGQPRTEPTPLIIETVPQIRDALLSEKKQWKESAAYFEKLLFSETEQDSVEIARILSDTYDDLLLQPEKKCAACGETATKRCSACKTTWYCSRKCQVESWGTHKLDCVSA